MSPKSEEGHWDSFGNSVYTEKEENEPSHSEIVVPSEIWMNASIGNGTCLGLGDQKDGCVYKRRKLHRDSVHFPGEATTNIKGTIGSPSCISSEDYLSEVQKTVIVRTSVGMLARVAKSVPDSDLYGIYSVGESEVPTTAPDAISSKTAMQHCYDSNDSCSSSKSNANLTSTPLKIETDGAGECSSCDSAELLGEFASARELCIYVLKSHELLGKPCTSKDYAALEIPYDDNNKLAQKCKTCKLLDDPLKMLICDHCDEAYHPSCCIPRHRRNQVKKIPVGEWYCQACFKKKPKPQYNKLTEAVGNQTTRRNFSILSMLTDTETYTTGVRIAKDFQVEVPAWCGPVPNEDDYFDKTDEMDPAESAYSSRWNGKEPQSCSIGNWVQCREVLNSDGLEDIICGKWRRAPVFVVQSDDWDCFCAVQWDPMHADCAVPQELETEEVYKHLKFIKSLRPYLAAKSRHRRRRFK